MIGETFFISISTFCLFPLFFVFFVTSFLYFGTFIANMMANSIGRKHPFILCATYLTCFLLRRMLCILCFICGSIFRLMKHLCRPAINKLMTMLIITEGDEEAEEGEVECLSNIKREQCGQCEETCEAVLVIWEAKFERVRNEWLRKMNDSVIEIKKELQRAEDAHQEVRRKWEEEKVQLVGKLSAAIASADLYRNLLHDNVRLFSEE